MIPNVPLQSSPERKSVSGKFLFNLPESQRLQLRKPKLLPVAEKVSAAARVGDVEIPVVVGDVGAAVVVVEAAEAAA